MFEQFVYAWSDNGLEGSHRYQVTAATPRIRTAFLARNVLLDTAAELSAWSIAPGDPSSRVVGWKLTRQGMFIWLKTRLASDHWAARGGHIVHMFHTTKPTDLRTVMSLISRDHIAQTEAIAQRSTELPVVPVKLQPDISDGNETFDLAKLLISTALTRRGREPAGVPATSEQMIAALLMCAARCPLPIFAQRNLTTSSPVADASNFAIAGIGPDNDGAGRSSAVPVVTLESLPEETLTAADVVLSERSHSTAALQIASGSKDFDFSLFEVIANILGEHVEAMASGTATQILLNSVASDIALESHKVRAALVAFALSDFGTLGQGLIDAAARHPNPGPIAAELATKVVELGFPSGIVSALAAHPPFREATLDHVADQIVNHPEKANSVPPPVLAAVLERIGTGSSEHAEARSLVLDSFIADRTAWRHIPELSTKDAQESLRRLWREDRFAEFAEGVGLSSSTVLRGCNEVILEDGGTKFDEWTRRDGPSARAAATKVITTIASSVRSASGLIWSLHRASGFLSLDEQFSICDGRISATTLAAADSNEREQLADIACQIIERQVLNRLRKRRRPILSSAELDLARVLASSSARARGLHAAGVWARGLQGQATARGWLPVVERRLAEMTSDSPLRTPVASLFLDGLLPVCADPDEIAQVVQEVGRVSGMSSVSVWSLAIDVFESHLNTGLGGRSLYQAALHSANEKRQFGRKQSTLRRPPKDLVRRTDRWFG